MMNYIAGDEVTVLTGSSITPVYTHLTVTEIKSAGSKVVLSDGSAWTQRGYRWGRSEKLSRFEDCLMGRKLGEQREAQALQHKANTKLSRDYREIVAKLDRVRPTYGDDNEAVKTLIDELRQLVHDNSKG